MAGQLCPPKKISKNIEPLEKVSGQRLPILKTLRKKPASSRDRSGEVTGLKKVSTGPRWVRKIHLCGLGTNGPFDDEKNQDRTSDNRKSANL